MAEKMVLIRNREGAEYQQTISDYRRKKTMPGKTGDLVPAAEAGFAIVSYADGTEYEEPKPAKADKDAKP